MYLPDLLTRYCAIDTCRGARAWALRYAQEFGVRALADLVSDLEMAAE